MLFADTAHAAATAYNLIYIALGVLGIGGGAGLYGLIRWFKRQTIRDSKLDELIDPEGGVMARLDKHGRQLEDLQRSMRPNGLNTNQLGDIAKRTEETVIQLRETVTKLNDGFRRHQGESDQIHRNLREAIDRKQDRVST
jgi:hypothetical protein